MPRFQRIILVEIQFLIKNGSLLETHPAKCVLPQQRSQFWYVSLSSYAPSDASPTLPDVSPMDTAGHVVQGILLVLRIAGVGSLI